MAFTTQYTLSQDATFRSRIQIAMWKAAIDISGESRASLGNLQWIKRQALAASVLRSEPSVWIDQFALAVCQNEALSAASTDGDIQFTVNSIWDDMAGVVGSDLG